MQNNIEFAVKGLVIADGKFLAVHKAGIKSDRFELPGGKMKFGETAEQTLIREMKEETGLCVVPHKVIDTWNYIINDTYQITGIIYLCRCDDVRNIILSDEHDKYEWLGFDMDSLSKVNRLFRPQMKRWDWSKLTENAARFV